MTLEWGSGRSSSTRGGFGGGTRALSRRRPVGRIAPPTPRARATDMATALERNKTCPRRTNDSPSRLHASWKRSSEASVGQPRSRLAATAVPQIAPSPVTGKPAEPAPATASSRATARAPLTLVHPRRTAQISTPPMAKADTRKTPHQDHLPLASLAWRAVVAAEHLSTVPMKSPLPFGRRDDDTLARDPARPSRPVTKAGAREALGTSTPSCGGPTGSV